MLSNRKGKCDIHIVSSNPRMLSTYRGRKEMIGRLWPGLAWPGGHAQPPSALELAGSEGGGAGCGLGKDGLSGFCPEASTPDAGIVSPAL